MVEAPIQTVTVDRISNGGNAIARQTHAGKTIHDPAGAVGETYEVRLTDNGGYLVAQLTDRATEIQPRQPSISHGPDTGSIGKDLINPDRNSSYSFTIKSSPAGGKLRSTPSDDGRDLRSWTTRKKL